MKNDDANLQPRVAALEKRVAELSAQLERAVKLIASLQKTAQTLSDRTWMLQRIG